MDSTRYNVLYLVNEYMYMCCAVVTMAFTDFSPDPETRFQIGWFYLSLLGLMLVINVVVMVQDIVLSAILFFKRRRQRRQVEEKRKKLRELKNSLPVADGEAEDPSQIVGSSVKRKSIFKKLEVIQEISQDSCEAVSSQSLTYS